jgi:hypothetical protein
MRIGVDFDNTIVCYDGAFHVAALQRGLIPQDLPRGKNDVRDFLNSSGRKEDFTELQGYVYGARMDLAAPYPGVLGFFERARTLGHELFIVSHKTRHPLRGARYDLHAAALTFLEANHLIGDNGRFSAQEVFFEETKDAKIARIAALELDAFIDDLPEILCMHDFPAQTAAILFDPDDRWTSGLVNARAMARYGNWPALTATLLAPRGPQA